VKRYHDSGGLYLEASRAGGKYWRWKYFFEGREKRLSFGAWPEVSLKEARNRRDDARRTLQGGVDPAPVKKSAHGPARATFREVAEEWRAKMGNTWAANHAVTVKGRLELDVYPAFGDSPIADIEPRDVLAMLRAIEERRAFETARRVLGFCSMIFRYAVPSGLVASDPCRDLRGALVPFKRGQHAALTRPQEVAGLMRAIDDYKGSAVVRAALRFSALTMCRPGEIRHAEWGEVDIDGALWTIPAEKMKARAEHRVPLSRQALEVLASIRLLTGRGRYVFPSPRGKERPLSENGVNTALRNMGYTKEQMTAHGFRSMASTLLNEFVIIAGWCPQRHASVGPLYGGRASTRPLQS
jgi:integrase